MRRRRLKYGRTETEHRRMILDDAARFEQDKAYYAAAMELHDNMPREFRDLANQRGNRAIKDFYLGRLRENS